LAIGNDNDNDNDNGNGNGFTPVHLSLGGAVGMLNF